MNSYTQLGLHGTCDVECYRHTGIHNVDFCRRLFQQDWVSVARSRRPPVSAAQKCALIMVHVVRLSLYFFTTYEGLLPQRSQKHLQVGESEGFTGSRGGAFWSDGMEWWLALALDIGRTI